MYYIALEKDEFVIIILLKRYIYPYHGDEAITTGLNAFASFVDEPKAGDATTFIIHAYRPFHSFLALVPSLTSIALFRWS